jgi:hypothetical protein
MRPRLNKSTLNTGIQTGAQIGRRPRKLVITEEDFLYEEFEDESPEEAAGGEDADFEPDDDEEVREAENGIEDGFAGEQPQTEPSDEPNDAFDAEAPILSDRLLPSITFYCEQSGSVTYVVSEHRDPAIWARRDGLARLLLRAAGDPPSVESLRKLHDLPQKDLIDFLGGVRRKGDISEFLRQTFLNIEGEYVCALRIFATRGIHTARGRQRAKEILGLSGAVSARQIEQQLLNEFRVKNSTARKWVKWAKQNR